MEPDHRMVLSQVVADVCQRQAFLFAEECDPDSALAAVGPFQRAAIAFTGPRQGILEVAATRSLTLELITNLLDLDPENEDATSATADALGELVNVICGQFLTAAFGSRAVFRLSIPEIGGLDEAAWSESAADPEALCLSFDESHAVVHLSLEEGRSCPSAC